MKAKGKPGTNLSGTELRTQRLRERLLSAADQLFMRDGFEAVSMAEIARVAKASKETFYRYFPTKELLFRAVVARHAENVSGSLGGLLIPQDPPEKALAVFGIFILQRIVTTESIQFHRVLSMERERFPELLQLYRTTGPMRVHKAVMSYLEQQIASGNLRNMDVSVAARQFFDLVAAEMIIGANLSGRAKPLKVDMQKRVAEAVDCFLHGYSSSQAAVRTL